MAAGFATPPTYTLCFVILDQTAGDYPGLTGFLPGLRDALDEYLNQYVAKWHGGVYAVRVGANAQDRNAGEVAINLRHNQDTDPQGALGWHQVTGGVEDIEIPLDSLSGLTGDGQALDVCASHEAAETAVDPGANQWADNGNGKVSAKEASDRVEDMTFKATNGLNLSNFLLPNAWVPGAPGPWDYMVVLAAQLDPVSNEVTMTPGGYDIEATTPNDVQDITPQARFSTAGNAKSEAWHKRKAHPLSRTSRRGVVL